MAQTLKFGKGTWATKTGSSMAYNDQNGNYKPLPFNVERDSIATRVNKQGLIEVVGKDKLRIDYKDSAKGVALLEPSRTNLITQSEAFDNAYWTKGGASVTSGFISPDGTTNAFKLVPSTDNINNHRIEGGFTPTLGNFYTYSVFVKEDEYKSVSLSIGASRLYATFSLTTKSVEVISSNGTNYNQESANIVEFNNGWLRLSLTGYSVNGIGSNLRLVVSKDEGSWNYEGQTYQGDGTSGIYIFGAQIEAGSYATSIINTSGSTVTRVADNAYQQSVTQVIGQSEGTLFLDFEPLDTSALQIMFQIRNSSSSGGQIDLRLQNGDIRALGNDGGLPQFNISGGSYLAGTNYKIAVRYKLNDTKFYINGLSVGSDTLCSFGATALQNISFADNLTNFKPSIKVKQTKLYNGALTDAELEYLTSYRSLNEMVTELNLNAL